MSRRQLDRKSSKEGRWPSGASKRRGSVGDRRRDHQSEMRVPSHRKRAGGGGDGRTLRHCDPELVEVGAEGNCSDIKTIMSISEQMLIGISMDILTLFPAPL